MIPRPRIDKNFKRIGGEPFEYCQQGTVRVNPNPNPNPTRSGRGPASAGLDRGFRPVEGLNRQNFSDLLPAKQFCCRPGQLLIICAGGVGLRKSKMSSWRQGDDEKASMQGPVPTVQRNGNRRFVTTVSGRLLLISIFEPPKAAS